MKQKKGPVYQGRIISGRYKGRKGKYQPSAALRPTPDRLKETLFNWLMAQVSDAVCLDLFAGTGLLGLEALSRGAAQVVFVDQEAAHIAALTTLLAAWGAAPHAKLYQAIVPGQCAFLKAFRFDIVFLDPPFAEPIHGQVLQALMQWGCVDSNTTLYCQWPKQSGPPDLGPHWMMERHYRAGIAMGGLFRHV